MIHCFVYIMIKLTRLARPGRFFPIPHHDTNPTLLAHGAGSPLTSIGLLCLGLVDTLGEGLSIFISCILGSLCVTALQCDTVTLVLETLGGDETLNLGSLGVWLLAFALGLDFTSDDELADIILLAEAEESSDLGGTLGTEALGVNGVGDARNVCVALLDDAESQDGEVHGDNAAADGLTLALTSSSWAVAGVAVGEEKSDTGWVHDTLLHWETLLVVAAGDLEDVSLELIANRVAWNLSTHTLLHEDSELSLVVNLDQFLTAIGRVGDIQLHDHGLMVIWS